MAIVTQELGSLEGLIDFEVDINDGFNPPRVVALRCVRNDSLKTAYAEIVRRSDGIKHSSIFPPNPLATAIAVPTVASSRITCTFNATKGQYEGFDGQILTL